MLFVEERQLLNACAGIEEAGSPDQHGKAKA
jgi:hypothetical protein